MHKLFVSSVFLAGAIGLSGCFWAGAASKDLAINLATALHQQMANGDLEGIYKSADQVYRDATTREKSDAYFNAIARKLGAPVTCGFVSVYVTVSTSGTFLRSSCRTPFSKDATGIESFVWKKSGDQYKLAGYNLNSQELVER